MYTAILFLSLAILTVKRNKKIALLHLKQQGDFLWNRNNYTIAYL